MHFLRKLNLIWSPIFLFGQNDRHPPQTGSFMILETGEYMDDETGQRMITE